MKKMYLASPFFDSHELNIYKMVIAELRAKGYEVYVPQEHEIENAWEKPNFVWGGVSLLRICEPLTSAM